MSQDSQQNVSSSLLRYAGLGLELTIVVAGLAFLGDFADKNWGSSPIGLMTGMAIGVAYAIWRCVRVLRAANS